MNPVLIARIKDVMALSEVGERTAKRRLSALSVKGAYRSLRMYCAGYGLKTSEAMAYVHSKRYDGMHCSRIKRVDKPLYTYEIRVWEEEYELNGLVQKLIFQEFVFFEIGRAEASCRVRLLNLPLAFTGHGEALHVPVLEVFMPQVLPVDRKAELLGYYGLMVLKRAPQQRICFVHHLEVRVSLLAEVARILRGEFSNSKKIWFCEQGVMTPPQKQAFGFQDIEGSGFAIAGVPGSDRVGKLRVRIER